jgi:hypothetical protein
MTGLHGQQPVTGIVTKIELKGTFGYPSITTDAEMICSLNWNSPLSLSDIFSMVESQHTDAPPKGRVMRLKQVELIEGELDKSTYNLLKRKIADKTIQQTPGGLKAVAIHTSVMDAAKKTRAAPKSEKSESEAESESDSEVRA